MSTICTGPTDTVFLTLDSKSFVAPRKNFPKKLTDVVRNGGALTTVVWLCVPPRQQAATERMPMATALAPGEPGLGRTNAHGNHVADVDRVTNDLSQPL
jgi:hypothetical protein